MSPKSYIQNLQRGSYVAVPLDTSTDNINNSEESKYSSETEQKAISFLWLYLTLSALTGFMTAIALVNLFPENLVRSGSGNLTSEDGLGDAKLRKLLDLPKEIIKFSPIQQFQDPPTKKSDEAWQAYLGPSLGLISLPNSKSYQLPPGANNGDIYQLSVAHQIQCLHLIQKIYYSASEGIYNVSANPQSSFVTHTNHCFDYLLQSVRCNADLALESATDSAGNFVGWGVEHVCTRWDSVETFMTKYKYDEATKAVDHHHHDDDDEDEHEHKGKKHSD